MEPNRKVQRQCRLFDHGPVVISLYSRAREAVAGALGRLAALWPSDSGPSPAAHALEGLLRGPSATGRQVAGMALSFWLAQARRAQAVPADAQIAAPP
eukprot:scaffold335038_cov34-Prasinocladus_malaysianus.AAC.1